MQARPWLGALGLRGKIVGAVLVVTVATLAVAALALLGPLENELRNSALKTLARDIGRGTTSNFTRQNLTYILDVDPNDRYAGEGRLERQALQQQQRSTGERLGATATLYGYPDVTGESQPVIPSVEETTDLGPPSQVARAFRTHHRETGLGTVEGTEVAQVAVPLTIGGQRFVLSVRRPIPEVTGAVHAVRNAFITAALAGLALTLILAIPLAATLVRRLRRLRQAALRLAQEGPGVEVPADNARDEVGDLARTLAAMQSQLLHQEEARRAFVATASHELRTPLTSLDGMLELLEDDLRAGELDLEDALGLLERARAQSHRLGRLAADLLDLSRLDAEVKLRSEPVELGELARAVLAEFELGTSEREIVSVLEDEDSPVWALGDPGSVARILRILLDNALRVSPRGGEITVELRADPLPSLSVKDRGPGVAPDERELIFERFQRGRDTGGQAGFGLGLAIGRELARRMGGELVLESATGGARFTLRLPVARARDEDAIAVL
ncbi:MAG: HAMP domain-containing histidine kinase [Solirubrobacterales bacterium]|nr:HAMP domain-containing histidine kinase [Solirubrobacterales bacterium]